VRGPEEVAGMAAAVAAQFGGVDILVTNAGLRRQTRFLDFATSA
jgi:NAD(P)-dependent dehydrogenase (short-subunit alcohol dehydrogenase family)